MRVLFVSKYAEPNPPGSNNNVYRQAKALTEKLGIDVEMLTWPNPDTWPGPWPVAEKSDKFAQLTWRCAGLNYHVVNLPIILLERVLSETDWQMAIEIGCELLERIDPSIVHLQHWGGLWWILESAKRLSIPTVYTAHDWGLGCLRTILVKGDGGLCDGVVGVDKCVACIWKGRNPIGKANELLISTKMGERIFKILEHSAVEPFLSRHGAVGVGLRRRVTLNFNRANAVLPSLKALIVPSLFAKVFFQQFGVSESRIIVEPWYYDLTVPPD